MVFLFTNVLVLLQCTHVQSMRCRWCSVQAMSKYCLYCNYFIMCVFEIIKHVVQTNMQLVTLRIHAFCHSLVKIVFFFFAYPTCSIDILYSNIFFLKSILTKNHHLFNFFNNSPGGFILTCFLASSSIICHDWLLIVSMSAVYLWWSDTSLSDSYFYLLGGWFGSWTSYWSTYCVLMYSYENLLLTSCIRVHVHAVFLVLCFFYNILYMCTVHIAHLKTILFFNLNWKLKHTTCTVHVHVYEDWSTLNFIFNLFLNIFNALTSECQRYHS